MPQLDPSTYPSQVIWFVLLFFVTYYLFLNTVLPTVARALKARSAASFGNASSVEQESFYPEDKAVAIRSVRTVSQKIAQTEKDFDKARFFIGQGVSEHLKSDVISSIESAYIRRSI